MSAQAAPRAHGMRRPSGAVDCGGGDLQGSAGSRCEASPNSVAVGRLQCGHADGARLFRQGFLTNALNPKVALFFLALLPQFIDAAAAHKSLAFLFLGAWFVVQGTLFLLAFVLLVAPLARWRTSPAIVRVLRALGGSVFVGLAARLALAQRP